MLGEMSRAALFGIVLVAAAITSTSCGSVLTSNSEKPSADEVEQALSLNQAGATAIGCAKEQGGWDYVCTFTDRAGQRKKIGLLMNEDGLERSSAAVAVDAQLAPPRAKGDQAFDSWIAQVNSLCHQNLTAIQGVPQPTSPADFGDYARQLSQIGNRYLKALSALPPPPDREDRRVFTHLIALLKQDDQGTFALSKAVQRGDGEAAQQLMQKLGERNAQENALFNRLGGNCL
jgi:hypothetical protein